MKSEIQVILPSDLDQELRRYFYRVAKEAVDQVRIETSLRKKLKGVFPTVWRPQETLDNKVLRKLYLTTF